MYTRSPVRYLGFVTSGSHLRAKNALHSDEAEEQEFILPPSRRVSQSPFFPRITTSFSETEEGNKHYMAIVRERLAKILPADFFTTFYSGSKAKGAVASYLNKLLPHFAISEFKAAPCTLSFYLLSKERPNAFKFFFEMISRWLIPGQRLNSVLFTALDFKFPDLSDENYTLLELMVSIENESDIEAIKRNLRIIETEICLGMESPYYANRILENKGLAADEKTMLIHERISALAKFLPQKFDAEIFSEMQHLLVLCQDEYKRTHEWRNLAKVIRLFHCLRKELRKAMQQQGDKRHVLVRLALAKIRQSQKQDARDSKVVLGIVVALNFLREHEIFEDRHVLQAIQGYIPSAKLVSFSYVSSIGGKLEPIRTMYVEIERGDDKPFTLQELRTLRKHLPNDLKGSVERLMHPVFMPRNEEEVMRNIVTLSKQLKYIKDIPQIILSFDEQSDSNLVFTVVMLRLLKAHDKLVQQLFESAETFLEYIPDRIKIVGLLRNKYPKEATVFRVRIKKNAFLRPDNSLDLTKARHVVVQEITRVVGEVRDYNGGMIAKQAELFSLVKNQLMPLSRYDEWLLENLFFSLTPVVMGTVLEPEPLLHLFRMVQKGIQQDFFTTDHYSLKFEKDSKYAYIIIAASDVSFKKAVFRAVSQLHLKANQVASIFVNIHDSPCLGYIFCSSDKEKQKEFHHVIESALKEWVPK